MLLAVTTRLQLCGVSMTSWPIFFTLPPGLDIITISVVNSAFLTRYTMQAWSRASGHHERTSELNRRMCQTE